MLGPGFARTQHLFDEDLGVGYVSNGDASGGAQSETVVGSQGQLVGVTDEGGEVGGRVTEHQFQYFQQKVHKPKQPQQRPCSGREFLCVSLLYSLVNFIPYHSLQVLKPADVLEVRHYGVRL